MSTDFDKYGDNWKNKPITDNQAELLHDLTCELISKMTRGEASHMIGRFLKKNPMDNNPMQSFDSETLEEGK
jgi:hypothetical protein|tara:strand:+ start:1017 stop:1232 length:216 start_codon:yes stop_codon:yes gene_type:complete